MTARIRYNNGLQNIHLDFSNVMGSTAHPGDYIHHKTITLHRISLYYIVLPVDVESPVIRRLPVSGQTLSSISYFPILKRHVEKMHNNLPISILVPSREVAKKTINLSTHCFPHLMSHNSNIYSRIITLFH